MSIALMSTGERHHVDQGRSKIRVAVVDNHDFIRESLVALLQSDANLRVVAAAPDGAEAPSLVQQRPVDVLVLNIDRYGFLSLGTIRQLRREAPRTKVIALAAESDALMSRQILAAGAVAVLTSHTSRDLFLATIHSVHLSSPSVDAARTAPRTKQLISSREQDVLRLIAQGLSNQDIATQLQIALGTVKRHTYSIYRKIGAHSRVDALQRATRLGLLQ